MAEFIFAVTIFIGRQALVAYCAIAFGTYLRRLNFDDRKLVENCRDALYFTGLISLVDVIGFFLKDGRPPQLIHIAIASTGTLIGCLVYLKVSIESFFDQ